MRLPLAASLAILASSPAWGQDSAIVGPRSLGMGGTGVAAADDHTAAYYNPAIYGFFSLTGTSDGSDGLEAGSETRLPDDPNYIGRKDWGVGLVDATMTLQMRGELGDMIAKIGSAKIGQLGNLGSDKKDLELLVNTLDLIENYAPARDNLTISGNVGLLNTRIMHVGIGVRIYNEAFLSVADLDRTNIGVNSSDGNVVDGIVNGAAPSGWTTSHTPTVLTGSALTNTRNALAASYGAADYASLNETEQDKIDIAVSRIDYAAAQSGQTAADMQTLAGTPTSVLPLALLAGTTSIEDNTTSVLSAGYGYVEIPLSFGYAINDNLSAGITLKGLIGEVAATKFRLVDNGNDSSGYLQDAFDQTKQTVTGSVDLGFAARWSWGQVGLTGRNLTSPSFKGGTFEDTAKQKFTVEDITLEPQVAVGVAFYPFETLCLTGDAELLETTTRLASHSLATDLPTGAERDFVVEYASQRVGAGLEWDAFRFLALRGGLYKNLADEEIPLVYTAGLGLNLWAVRLDLAGAVTPETIEVDGQKVPKTASVSAGLAIDF